MGKYKWYSIGLISLLWSCSNSKTELDESKFQQQIKWVLQESEANYKPLSFSKIDSQFLTIDDQWDFEFYYLNKANQDTLIWSYDQFKVKALEKGFSDQFEYLDKRQRLMNSQYYGMGYVITHMFCDSVLEDTYRIEIQIDTNLNIKKKTLLQ